MAQQKVEPMSPLEFHVVLALASGPLYGYAIRDAVIAESNESLTPRAGSLYRIIGRLMSDGLLRETHPPESDAVHPGLERKYYMLTANGRRALAVEAQRLKQGAAIAAKRLGIATRRS